MQHCSPQAFVILFAGFFLFPVHAQTVNLTGTVKDSSTQQGVGNAVVKIVGLNVSDTTDANGNYSLANSAIRFFGSPSPGNRIITAPRITHSGLFFGVSGDAARVRVRIDLYDLSGRHVASLIDKMLGQGNYRINPYSSTLSRQIYFVKIKSGNQTAMVKMPFADKPALASGGASSSPKGDGALKKTGDAEASPTGDGAIGNGLAKPAAVNDTLAVFSAGYLINKKPIASYTGVNDFSLVWTGLGGNILFEMASYQGCQIPALIVVVDSSASGPTLSVHVRSTTTPAGFSMSLKPVTGAVGTYADSVYFSIKNTDSTKRILKVLDQDSVVASYDHGAPSHAASLRTTGTYWSGTTGQIGPGASQYFGLRAKMLINLFDSDLTDSGVIVTVKSPKDTTGISLALKPLPGNPGCYSRQVGFSLTASVQDSIIAIDGRDSLGQLITMIYHDAAPAGAQLGSICTWIPARGIVILDSAAYHGTTGTMMITLIDDDILDSSVVVTVKSNKDATGIRDTLKSGDGLPGSFSGLVGFSLTASTKGVIAVADNDTVTVTYQDETPIGTSVQKASWNSH